MKICIDSKHEGVCFAFYQYSHTSSSKNNLKHILNHNMTVFIIDVNNVYMNQVGKYMLNQNMKEFKFFKKSIEC